MPPIDTSALAAIFAWVWDEYGKTIIGRLTGAAKERIRWDIKAQDYGQKVQRLYGTMQILGQARPVPLEDIYTAVSLLDKPTAWGRYTLEEMQADFTGRGRRYFHASGEEKRRDGLDMVKGGENLFILGKPGAGKTTFLKHVALRGVNGDLERVPIFIGLKQLSDSGLSVFDFVVNEFDVCGFPDAAAYLDRLLKAGKAILLFDGLDEVNVAEDERKRLIDDVEAFTRKYDQCQRLITCRLAANDYSFQGYTYVEMADFNKAQIGTFIAKWFSDDVQRRELFLSELQKSESEGLRELARVPLLLALLCLGFEETLKLSSRRAELYEEALDALLKKWDSGRNIQRDEVYRDLSLKRKEQMLAQVAAETFDRAEYFIPEKTLTQSFETFLARMPNATEEIDGETVLRAIVAQHGLFTERARDIYSFAHLTFQEYFTARYVVENEARGTLPRLIEHYADPRYREVFLLTAAQLPEATAFFDMFLDVLASDIREHPAILALLQWTMRRATMASKERVSGVAARSLYVLLALSVKHDFTLPLDFDLPNTSGFDITKAHALARDLALNINRDLAITIDLDLNLHRALNLLRTSVRDLALPRAIAQDYVTNPNFNFAENPYPSLARDLSLVNSRLCMDCALAFRQDSEGCAVWLEATRSFVSTAAAYAALLGDADLLRELKELNNRIIDGSGFNEKGAIGKWDANLWKIMDRCDLIFPELGIRNWDTMLTYLSGNLLLLECLSQATVTDREAIKDRLLLLPEA